MALLLRRTGFGGSAAEVDALVPLEWPEVVERVLDVSSAPPAHVGVPDLNPARSSSDRLRESTFFWLERCRTSPAPLVEKLVLFWHGLLCSSQTKVGDHQMMFDQNQLFRTHGMGNVVELYQAMAIQPAMLKYLDGRRNVAKAPNENFARELMELFCLGSGHHSQGDVLAAARAWTGHGIDGAGAYALDAAKHDGGLKTFFGDTRNWDGPDIIAHLFTGGPAPIAARYLARRLWSFLAYPNPEAEVIEALAAAFAASGLRIDALVRAILLRPEFRSLRSRQGLVRSPVEFTVAAMRATGTPCSVARPDWWLSAMGQRPYFPPNVAGWGANRYWLSTSAMWARSGFVDHLAWRLYDAGLLLADTAARSPEEAVEDALRLYGIDEVGPTTRQALLRHVQTERPIAEWRVRRGLLLLPLLCPEFQLA